MIDCGTLVLPLPVSGIPVAVYVVARHCGDADDALVQLVRLHGNGATWTTDPAYLKVMTAREHLSIQLVYLMSEIDLLRDMLELRAERGAAIAAAEERDGPESIPSDARQDFDDTTDMLVDAARALLAELDKEE